MRLARLSYLFVGATLAACGGTSSTHSPGAATPGNPASLRLTPPVALTAEATGATTRVDLGQASSAGGRAPITITNDAPQVFPLGTTAVTWRARDATGAQATGRQDVTVRDTTPPFVTAPPDQDVTVSQQQASTISLGQARAMDAVGVSAVSNDAPTVFPIGTTQVTWTAVDASGNAGTAVQTVVVRLSPAAADTTAPVVTPPADVNTTSADGQPVAVQIGRASATDNTSVASLVSDAPTMFPVGLTIVTWTALDTAGNRGTATQRVTVTNATATDKVAPVITLSGGASIGPLEATGPRTSVNLGSATARDAVDGTVAVRNDAPADGFAVGTTTVTWFASDKAGNAGTALQRVTVKDSTPPRLTAPANITADAYRSRNRIALGTATARDTVSGELVPRNDAPAEGLPIGTTNVRWSAADGAGNEATASQTVTLKAVACSANKPFFQQQVWPQVLNADCISCHTSTGVTSAFNLTEPAAPNALDLNLAAFKSIAVRKDGSGRSLALTKPANLNADHGGRERFPVTDPRYSLLDEMVDRLAVCIEDTPSAQQGLMLTSPYQHLRRATLALAGRLPTAAEERSVVAAAPADLNKAMNAVLDPLMAEPGFYERLKDIYNDVLLTDALAGAVALTRDLGRNFVDEAYFDFATLRAQGYTEAETNNLRARAGNGLSRAPLELIAYVVKNDRPFTEILTADYTMVNPYSARIFGATPNGTTNFAFTYGDPVNKASASDFRPAALTDKNGRRYAHAGVLTTFAFLARYPSTPTNRNRARARYVFEYFLDTDVQGLANRAGLDLDNLIGEFPTLQDPQCKVCHDVIDPVAGLLKNWNDDGVFRGDYQNWFNSRNPQQMLAPGYTAAAGDALPSTESARAAPWLARRIVADSRFAVSTVKTLLGALLGEAPRQDAAFIESLKTRFAGSNFNLKALIKDIVASDYFRAVNLPANANPAQYASYGVHRLLTPEQLHAKIQAVTGGYTWRSPSGKTLLDANSYLLLYGGIDSEEVTERTTDTTGVMAAIQDRIAYQTSCEVVPADLAKTAASRALFPNIAIADKPDNAGGTANIKGQLQQLHKRLLGEELPVSDPEITRSYELFVAARTASLATPLPADCARGLSATDPVVVDADGTVRAWMAVTAYLLSDFKFFSE